MRKHDPQAQEDGFHLLQPVAAEHVDDLIAAFTAEQKDHGLRCWLLELIGDARSPNALPLLADQLHSADNALQTRAMTGLRQLGTKQARQLLWQRRQDDSDPFV